MSQPPQSVKRAWVVPVVSALSMIGCDAQESGSAHMVRDSSGVTIVENRRATWTADAAWRLSPSPSVEIGIVDGPAQYQLFGAWSSTRLTDGRIVIADAGSSELRFFDGQGLFLFSAGGPGEGPGEFQDLQRVWRLPGDSLLAYDFFPSRLSVFEADGTYVRAVDIRSSEGRQLLVKGPLPDGSLIVNGTPIWDSPDATEGIVTDSVPLYRYDADGDVLSVLGFFPSVEALRIGTEDGWRMTSPPFPRIPVTTVFGEQVVFGAADAYELEIYDIDGGLERVIRLSDAEMPLAAEDIARFRRARLEEADAERTRPLTERMLRAMPIPETAPAYARLLVDGEGHLWVADYRVTEDEPWNWRVFTPRGEYLGDVAVSDRFEVHEIGTDYVLGLWRDDLDVEYIRMYGLVKPS